MKRIHKAIVNFFDFLEEKTAFLNSVPAMIVSGVFLFISLVSLLLNFFWKIDLNFPIDPAWLSIAISGTPLVLLALHRIVRNFYISSALLISIAMVAAILEGEIFAAGEVAFIMAIGAWLEERTTEKAKKGIEGLLKLVPEEGRRISTDASGNIVEEIVASDQLEIGDIIRILPGENIPADGTVINGNTSVNQAILTGESLPVDKALDDDVYAATINQQGSIDIKITKAFKDSSLQKMINLVKEAENNQAPMQKIVDKWATWLVPLAVIIALGAWYFTGNSTAAVTILVVFCPCALALATPTAIVAAIGQGTKHGVLIKSGEALEKMGKIATVCFDKTGTLTVGKLSVSDIVTFGVKEEEMLKQVGSCESHSEHPIGKAIVQHIKEKNISFPDPENFVMTAGMGVTADVDGDFAVCGNEKLMANHKIRIPSDVQEEIDRLRGQGKAVIIVGSDKYVSGVIALSDVIKESSKDTVRGLTDAGITNTVLLTGDNEKTARYVADQVGITNIKASLLPENKVEEVKKLQDSGELVCMVGDGVNDAPALKLASVGIAMGTIGSDIAIDAADIALMGDDIEKISFTKRLSNATIKNIKFNITASMVINAVAIVLSIMSLLTPITAALWHNAGSVLVVLNAAKLYNSKI